MCSSLNINVSVIVKLTVLETFNYLIWLSTVRKQWLRYKNFSTINISKIFDNHTSNIYTLDVQAIFGWWLRNRRHFIVVKRHLTSCFCNDVLKSDIYEQKSSGTSAVVTCAPTHVGNAKIISCKYPEIEEDLSLDLFSECTRTANFFAAKRVTTQCHTLGWFMPCNKHVSRSLVC